MDYSYSLSDYDFVFPQDLIAQRTAGKGRTQILHVPKEGGPRRLLQAPQIVDLFRPGDCLVVNNTKVIPARLFGHKKTGGEVEVLLVQTLAPTADNQSRWEAFVRPGRAFPMGASLEVAGVACFVESIQDDGTRILHFAASPIAFSEILHAQGHIPLPPYIDREDDEDDRIAYQTVFAKVEGAVAAPTASLHFSEEMLASLRTHGVEIVEVTLHVGPGTFQNIQVEDFRGHQMHAERFEITAEAAATINACKARGGRIVTVGTTSTRVLETVADETGLLRAFRGETQAFIYPGYRWKIVDGLLTNFHWPKSSLILLVSAMLGRERTLDAYREAVEQRLKLFSYGDGMLIL